MYVIDGFRRKAGEVIGDVSVLDGCAVNWLFPYIGEVLSAGGGGLEFVQGLIEVSGNLDVARTSAVVPCDGEVTV